MLFIVGAPVTPGSVAGLHRRTRRRTAAVVSTSNRNRVTTLPEGCTKMVKGGVPYYNCSGVYYQTYYEGSQVVYVAVDAPK